MNELCERCLEDGIQQSGTVDEYGNGPWCDDCRDAQAEAAHERRLESGGGVSIAELMDRAYRERAALRRME